MKVYVVKKQKGRIYQSEDVFSYVAEAAGLTDCMLTHLPSGAPHIEGGPCISVSDTKNVWCCVLSEAAVGIDIEEPRSVRPSVVRRLHALEAGYLSWLESGSREWTEELLAIWTRKESYLKFCGEGLRMGLSGFSVIGEDLSYLPVVSCKDHPHAYMQPLSLPYGLTGALCSAGECGDIEIVQLHCPGQMALSVYEKATQLLAQQNLPSAQLRKKLIACGYGEDEAETVVSEFERRGYLDDTDYAERYVRRAAASGKGVKRIRQELRQKGIDAEASERVLAALSEEEPESERERAFRAVSGMPCGSEKEKARIARRLASLGYEASVIYDVIDQFKG